MNVESDSSFSCDDESTIAVSINSASLPDKKESELVESTSGSSNDAPTSSDGYDSFEKNLNELASSFKKNMIIKDRRYLLKIFKQCFIGSEAVDFMVSSGMSKTRNDAVQLGRALATDLHLFEHVTRDHEFEDGYKFYRFLGESERGGLKHDNNRYVRWSQFMDPGITCVDRWSSKSRTSDYYISGLQNKVSGGNSAAKQNAVAINLSDQDAKVMNQIWPRDEYNTNLLDNVHPPEWQAPKPKNESGKSSYDLVVLGAGSGGLKAATEAAAVGARVALIEVNLLGGDCLNFGCVPSKALIGSAKLVHKLRGEREQLEETGIYLDPSDIMVDFKKVMKRMRKIRSQISRSYSAERYSKNLGVEIYLGSGKFSSEKTIKVNKCTVQFKRAIVATGGVPFVPPIPGLEQLYKATNFDNGASSHGTAKIAVMTNETIFNLTGKPKKMMIIGAGIMGMELGQAFQHLGVSVTIVEAAGQVLHNEDADLAQIVRDQMENQGVKFLLSTLILKVELTGNVLSNGYSEMKVKMREEIMDGHYRIEESYFDAIFITVGRRPAVLGIGLPNAKVKYDDKGIIVSERLQTSNPRIYSVGGCCADFRFTHAAEAMARIAVKNALFLGKEKMSKFLVPYVTFTSPEIASVGLHECDIQEKGIPYDIVEIKFQDNDGAICDNATTGLIRLRVESRTGKILGAIILGDNASNLISEITLAMQSDITVGFLAAVIHPYSTRSEVIQQVGEAFNRLRLTSVSKSILRGIIKIQK